jgi:chromosome segregation and condensation protein ScpB
MDGDAQLAARYRIRAEEVRAIAQIQQDEKAIKTLNEVARDYDQMAHALEETSKAGKMREPNAPRGT